MGILSKQANTNSTFRKYSDPFTFLHFVTLQPYSNIDYIVIFFSPIYTQYPIMTKQKHVCGNLSKLKYDIYICIQTLYSVVCWSTFGSDYSSWLWRYKLGTPVFWEFLPFFSADPLTLSQVGSGASLLSQFRSLQRCSIGFKSGLWLGHSRTFRDLSRSHSGVVLAVCLGLLS